MPIKTSRSIRYIRNGNGISYIQDYYLATSASSGVTTSTAGWTTTVQTVTPTKKYLWNYRKTVFDNGSMSITTPTIIGTYGDKGDSGPTLRGPQAWSDCEVGYSFQAGGEGEEWKDVVLYNGYYYSCIKSHTKTSSNYPKSTADTQNGYWKLGDSVELVATKILLAKYSYVENLGAGAIVMKNSSGDTVFEAKDGNVTCKTGTFENVNITGKLTGSVRNPFVSAGGSFDTDYSDNVSMLSSGGSWINAYSLPWDATQSGRRITITNYKWGSTVSNGYAAISAPTGKYFYEDGIQKTSLGLSREAVELLGYGDGTTFYGWIVMRRVDLVGGFRYGRGFKALAYGDVATNGTITYRTFDGSTLSCLRSNLTGQYVITMPSTWFASATDVGVMLTGFGYSEGSTSAPIKATVIERTTTKLRVITSDDDTPNYGAFDFLIFNKNDFLLS